MNGSLDRYFIDINYEESYYRISSDWMSAYTFCTVGTMFLTTDLDTEVYDNMMTLAVF